MTVLYTILEKDYLDHLLYVASQNVPNRKARFRARIALPVVAALCAIFFLLSAD